MKSRWSSSMKTLAVGERGQALESEWWRKQKVCYVTNSGAGDKCESTTKFFFANIHYYFVKSKSLGLVDGDSPG